MMLFLVSLSVQGADKRPSGCLDPDAMAKALMAIQQRDWQELSYAQVQRLWPSHLFGIDCDSEACATVSDQGRIINGDCQCCALFVFDQIPIKGENSGPLHSIIIHYSAKTRKEVLTAMKTLALAFGMPKHHIASLGKESDQSFQWETDQSRKEFSVVDSSLSNRESLWRLYFYYSRFRIDP
jgi:hypothetical protein